ncbi:MAG: PepSY domain-containing protein [Mogibacterium sp.]|nr:PepSY domain-containing protein [Mogibacterium sp.]
MKRLLRTVLALFTALAMVMTMSASIFAAGITSNDTALEKALKNAELKKSQVKCIEVEYDKEDGIYEIEFTQKNNGKRFDYEIAAGTGKIMKKAIDYKYKKNTSKKKIGKKAARKKVAKFSGTSYKIVSKGTCKYEYDNRQGTYEIKFKKGSYIYECEVLAPTGKIIEYEWKVIGYDKD